MGSVRPDGVLSFGKRSDHLARLAGAEHDLLVVGGGITGAGIALDAVTRGLSVALVDKGDFAAGTSMRSTKLVHGGLRYLAQYEFALTHEALTERAVLADLAPGLVHWLPFVLPIYGSLFEFGKLFAGLWLYDALAVLRTPQPHRQVSRAALARMAPGLGQTDLVGGFVYSDCGTDDARLTLEVLRTAAARGATIANYAEVTDVRKDSDGRAIGVRVRDVESGECLEVRGKQIVFAGGVWADQLARLDDPEAPRLVRPAKGVHLVIDRRRFGYDCALFLPTRTDGRLVFVIPWQGATLVGTTDTDYAGPLEAPTATAEDVSYLLDSVNRAFPGAKLTPSDVVSVQAGLRPLIGAGNGSTAHLSREDKIAETPSGIITIAGGKLTTYRKMAQRVTDLAQRRLLASGAAIPATVCATDRVPIGAFGPGPVRASAALDALPTESVDHLRRAYGANAGAVAALVAARPELGAAIISGQPNLKAEVVHAARHEMARHLSDVLARRTHVVQLDREQGRAAADEVARLLGDELGWSEARRRAEVERFHEEVRQFTPKLAAAGA